MTRRQRDIAAIDFGQWPEANVHALTKGQPQDYERREQAIRSYVSGGSLATIQKVSGIGRRQLYRLLDRCLTPHDDGRVYGFRGLLRYQHIHDYHRNVQAITENLQGKSGAAGAFGALVDAYPTLQDWLQKLITERRLAIEQIDTDGQLRLRLRGLNGLHLAFLNECRQLGLNGTDYPFNTDQMGRRTLSAVIKAQILRNFGHAARTSGASHLKGMRGPEAAIASLPQCPLDVVEVDGHTFYACRPGIPFDLRPSHRQGFKA